MVSLTDVNRQWFLARTGVDMCEINREHSFCGHAILRPDIMQVPDARRDLRFADNPLVTDDPGVVFYAGRPLRALDGVVLTLERLTRCRCAAGCPACIVSPKCGNANQVLDKHDARTLLGLLLG